MLQIKTNQQKIRKILLVLSWCCALLFFCSCSQQPEDPENQDTPLKGETKEITL